jgi:hypothetical protein
MKRQWGFDYIITKKSMKRASADVGFIFIAYNLRRIINILTIEKLLELLASSYSQIAINLVSESLKRIYASLNPPKITLLRNALELFDFLLCTTFTKNTRPTAGF